MQLPTHHGGITPGDRVTLVRICLSLAEESAGANADKTEVGSEGDWLKITRCILRQISVRRTLLGLGAGLGFAD